LGDRPQRDQVDLGVDRGGRQIPVPQHLADVGQRDPVGQQLGRQRVPQPMWPHRGQAGATAGTLHDVADQVRPDTPARGAAGHEQLPTPRSRTSVGQISSQGLAHLDRQWQPVTTSCLAADHQLATAPVHVVQLQARDLDRAQPEPRHQDHDREVAGSDRGGPVAAIQQRRDIRRGQRRRYAGVVPAGDRRHRRRQRQRRQALQIQSPQQRTQLRNTALRRAHAAAGAFGKQEPAHLDAGQARDIHRTGAKGLLLQEPAGGVLVTQHRRRRQVTIVDQPLVVGLDQLIQRGARGWTAGHHDVFVNQVLEQQHQAAAARRLPELVSTSIDKELPDPGETELGRRQPASRHPPPELTQHLQLTPHRLRRITQRQQIRLVAIDVRAELTRLPPRP
jgi:hypothetical protein